MKYNLPIAISILILSACALISGSCCKAYINDELFYTNETSANIELRFYSQGTYKLVMVEKDGQKLPFVQYPADSVVAYVDNVKRQVHYSAESQPTASAISISFTDARNILNYSNYQQKKIPLKCDGSITEMTYTFK